MKYQKIDEFKTEILPGEVDIGLILVTLARMSYRTAVPRGRIVEPHNGILEPDFERYIERAGDQPYRLVMDYIDGRDCRTKVFSDASRWFFDTYVFRQRKVNAREFIEGVVKDDPLKFLDSVIDELCVVF
jgi:hypothetical protein